MLALVASTFPCISSAKTAWAAHLPWDALQGCSNVPVGHCYLYPSRLSPQIVVRATPALKKCKTMKGSKKGEKVPSKDELNSSLLGALDSQASGRSGLRLSVYYTCARSSPGEKATEKAGMETEGCTQCIPKLLII